MDIEELRNYCLYKPFVTESFPFDEDTLVFKVGSKMFCLTNINGPLRINLKCDPEKAVELREEFDEIIPGFHMNKIHWNTIDLEGGLSNNFIMKLVDLSYTLVASKLSKKK